LTCGEIFGYSFIRYGVVGLTAVVTCTLSDILKVIGQNIDLLVRAFITYVRPLLEYDSVVWSPSLKRDVILIEQVQKRFTKRLRGYRDLRYVERLKRLNRRGGVQRGHRFWTPAAAKTTCKICVNPMSLRYCV